MQFFHTGGSPRMRGMETGKTRIRHSVFTEIARLAYDYEGDDYAKALEELTYKICPGDPDDIGKAYKSASHFAHKAGYSCAYDTEYKDYLPLIEEKQ